MGFKVETWTTGLSVLSAMDTSSIQKTKLQRKHDPAMSKRLY